jgi:hypothetical protein
MKEQREREVEKNLINSRVCISKIILENVISIKTHRYGREGSWPLRLKYRTLGTTDNK